MRILTIVLTSLAIAACSMRPASRLEKAEQLLREEKYDDAIAVYREHMESRLAIEDRPEWENPYFYLLLIGDVELGRGLPEKATEYYNEAAEKGVHATLISDRYRSVARWYEDRDRLNDAMSILRAHRDLDTLLFDAMLDRIGKRITEKENRALVEAAAEDRT